MITVKLTVQGTGGTEKREVPEGATLSTVLDGNYAGRTVFLRRNGLAVEGTGPDTVLADGDDLIVITNTKVGIVEG